MNYCGKCGAKVRENAKFCMKCGNRFDVSQPAEKKNMYNIENAKSGGNTGRELWGFTALVIAISLILLIIFTYFTAYKPMIDKNTEYRSNDTSKEITVNYV